MLDKKLSVSKMRAAFHILFLFIDRLTHLILDDTIKIRILGSALKFIDCQSMKRYNFSGYIEQGSVQMAQEWVKNVVNPNLVTDSFDKNKLYSDLNDMQALFSYAVEHGLLKKDFPVEDFSKTLVDVLYGEMLCWCMSDGAYSFRERTQEYCKKYLVILIQPYLKQEEKRT